MGVVEEDNLTSQQRERHDSMHSTHKVEYFLESGGGGGGGPLLLAGELEKNKLKQSSEQFLVVVVAVVVYVASKFNSKKRVCINPFICTLFVQQRSEIYPVRISYDPRVPTFISMYPKREFYRKEK